MKRSHNQWFLHMQVRVCAAKVISQSVLVILEPYSMISSLQRELLNLQELVHFILLN